MICLKISIEVTNMIRFDMSVLKRYISIFKLLRHQKILHTNCSMQQYYAEQV